MNNLSEKELAVIERIGGNSGKLTQREIALHTRLSVGLTNLILKKLTKTGYIKVKQLTPKKMHYILTRKGMIEKAQKSYNYILKTVNEVRQIDSIIQQLFVTEHKNGKRVFGIIGNGEFSKMIELAARDIPEIEIQWLPENFLPADDGQVDVIIDCRRNFIEGSNNNLFPKTINLIDYIARYKYEYTNA